MQRPRITSPMEGEVVQGNINVTGSTRVEGFSLYEVAYSYQEDATGTWFLLNQSREIVSDGVLAVWDTTTIADGTYNLRLVIVRTDGSSLETVVGGLRVRNYTPIETASPLPQDIVTATAVPAVISTPIGLPSPTPMQPNPAEVSLARVGRTLLSGALWMLAVFVLLGLYIGIRSLSRR
ncbi:MAG: hypothetical protein HPY76_13095 [Anaerolineae bacterium]|nr:hypothetical protein [Anaerolineae bacterium]